MKVKIRVFTLPKVTKERSIGREGTHTCILTETGYRQGEKVRRNLAEKTKERAERSLSFV